MVLGVVRSPHAHARILGVSTPPDLPGVAAVLTGAALGAANRPLPPMISHPLPRFSATQRPLALNRVRFVGEPVAVVLAESVTAAEDAVERITVDYEPLPAVIDPGSALSNDAPLLHEGSGRNDLGSWALRAGDPEAAFAGADVVVSATLEIARISAQPIETRGVLAVPDPTGDMLTVWTTTQVPHPLRLALADALTRPEQSLRVVCPDVGGAFGSKLILYPEEVLCALLALRFRRPVKWVEGRREHLLATGHARAQVHQASLAARRDGTIVGLRDHFWHDSGAYAPYGLRLPLVTAACLAGPYRIPNIEASFTAVFTNTAPVIPYRGAGQPEAVFVLERLIDRMARRLEIEPTELRRRNLIPPSGFPHDTGLGAPGMGSVRYDAGSALPALEEVRRRLDVPAFRTRQRAERENGRWLGLGVACYQEATGAGTYESATVSIDAGGWIDVACGVASQGQGHETVLAQVAAEAMAVPVERVRVRIGDTGAVPYGVGTWGSRTAAVAAAAVAAAASEVKANAVRVASRLLEARPEDIRWDGDRVSVAGAPERMVRFADLARAASSGRGPLMLPEGPGLAATRHFAPSALTYASGAHGVVVEVDPESRTARVVRYIVAHDCGRLLNPTIVTGQTVGGVVQGMGEALGEQIVYDGDGQLLSSTFAEYALPRAKDVPPIEVVHLETPSRVNPLGARGAGEGGIMPVPAAIAAAVEDALAEWSIEVNAVPVTLRALDALLRASGEDQSSSRRGSISPARGADRPDPAGYRRGS